MSKKCPYCNKVFENDPKRKGKCRYCGKTFVIRKEQALTINQGILVDSKKRLEYLNVEGVNQAKTLDELWFDLNQAILNYSMKGKFDDVASIYLNMGVIAETEGHYKDCIKFYLLCSHFSAYDMIKEYQKLGMKLTFDDLMKTENYMISSPVKNSIKELGLDSALIDDLGRLSVTPSLEATEKIEILKEVFSGEYTRLKNIPHDQKIPLRIKKPKKDIFQKPRVLPMEKVSTKKTGCTGCFGAFVGVILSTGAIAGFIK
ncbi:MAG: hypothetical protein WCJ58_03780 [bacterium]